MDDCSCGDFLRLLREHGRFGKSVANAKFRDAELRQIDELIREVYKISANGDGPLTEAMHYAIESSTLSASAAPAEAATFCGMCGVHVTSSSNAHFKSAKCAERRCALKALLPPEAGEDQPDVLSTAHIAGALRDAEVRTLTPQSVGSVVGLW